MRKDTSQGVRLTLDQPPKRRPILGWLATLGLLVSIGGLLWAWERGYRPSWAMLRKPVSLDLVEVDRGDIVELIVENGSVESASDAVVRCQVEALIGTVGGSSGSTQGARSASGSGSRSAAPSGGGGAVATKGAGAATKGGATAKGAAGGSSSGSASASAAGSTTAGTKPQLRSFSYAVAPYTPLKSNVSSGGAASTARSGSNDTERGGGRGGGGDREERAGSTRILWILPEGSEVKAGDVVCELDSAAFRDELRAQEVRYLQAKAWVDQAAAILEVNKITYREYRDGIYPQDLQLIRQYIQTCQIERERAERNVEWSQGMADQHLRTAAQLRADKLALQQADFVLSEAEGMLNRLEKFTAPKILKTLEAKLAAILTDKLAQDAMFALETERLERLKKNIAACTMRAPRDGIVVYANQANAWGRVETQIMEGVTVREDQPIFQLPDPNRMRIKARINETKVSQIRTGQKCTVVMDAYPDRRLNGTVTDVTVISTPVNGPFSDVRVYFALIAIDKAFDGLRPGLSGEVTFLSDQRKQVERLPIAAVREVDGKAFVAIPDPSLAEKERAPYRWQKVELGLSDSDYVEVLSGVEAGDRVVANPSLLSSPITEPTPANASPIAAVVN